MKLTRLQRYTAYILLLIEAEKRVKTHSFNNGLCGILETALYIDGVGCRTIQRYLPELSNRLFKRNSRWMSRCVFEPNEFGWKQRISMLEKCIQQTHPDRK